MHSKDINSDILKDEVFYLHGNDFYWLDNANSFFIGLVEEKNRDVSVKVYNEIESLADIIFTLQSFSFNEGKQILFVKDSAYKAQKDELKVLRQTIKEGIEPYILIFENVSFLTASEKKMMTEIDCSKLDKINLIPQIEKITAHHGGIDRQAVFLLIDYTNNEMAKINLELKKLIDYSQGKKITTDMVELMVSEDTELQIYQFVNSIVEGRKDKAVVYLDKLIKKGESKSYILASLINQFRRIFHSALSPKSNSEIAEIFRVKEYAIKKARETKILSKPALKNTLEMLINYEYKFKSGIMNEATAFYTAISRLLA